MFLENHPRQYRLSYNDCMLSLSTGFSGAPYSERRFELIRNVRSEVWGEATLANLEALPILGGLIGLVERIIFFIKEIFFSHRIERLASLQIPRIQPEPREAIQLSTLAELLRPTPSKDTSVTPLSQEKIAKHSLWRPRSLPLNEAISKARRNMEKALVEHVSKERRKCYASAEEAIPSLETLLKCEHRRKLSVKKYYVNEAQGKRPTMEDAHFYAETSVGVFVGVLDGHGGEEVALFARDQFQKRWFELLEKTGANVHQAFEFLFDETHQLVANRPEWNRIGTTAVLCYVNKQTHQIYTATVGDSEANIYRNIDGQLKSIPLSCVRDWHSRKDAARAAAAFKNPQIAVDWPSAHNPKLLRFPRWDYGVNVSRGIGDQDCRNTKEKPGVIHKPKITINLIQPGDKVILACDGLKDFREETRIIDVVKGASDPAKDLVDDALPFSRDNITVVAVDFADEAHDKL